MFSFFGNSKGAVTLKTLDDKLDVIISNLKSNESGTREIGSNTLTPQQIVGDPVPITPPSNADNARWAKYQVTMTERQRQIYDDRLRKGYTEDYARLAAGLLPP